MASRPRLRTSTSKGGRSPAQFEQARQLWSGIWAGRFEQTFSLPTAVDAEGAQAQYEGGVLTLRLPKAQHARAHTIKVSGAAGEPKVLEAAGT